MTESLKRWLLISICIILLCILVSFLSESYTKKRSKEEISSFDLEGNKNFVNMVDNIINKDDIFSDKDLLRKVLYSLKILFFVNENCFKKIIVFELPDYEDPNKLLPIFIEELDLKKIFKQLRYIKNIINHNRRISPIYEVREYYSLANNLFSILKNRLPINLSQNLMTAINKNVNFIECLVENSKDFLTQEQLDFINQKELVVDNFNDKISVLDLVMILSIHLLVKENGRDFTI